MKTLTIDAHAKLNLSLDILGTRPDGYHDLRMVMQTISLADKITLCLEEGTGIQVTSSREDLPRGEDNLAGRAALVFRQAVGQGWNDLAIHIEKNIPVCAGTAGGSSDAAAVLRGLNQLTGAGLSQETLLALAAIVGSDVPFCLHGGTALAQGRGERLTQLPALPDCFLVLCKPDFDLSTPFLFQAWDETPVTRRPDTDAMLQALEHHDLKGVARLLCNVFEDVLTPTQQAQLHTIRRVMIEEGALNAAMTGSGPAVFGIFTEKTLAEIAAARLRKTYHETFMAVPV